MSVDRALPVPGDWPGAGLSRMVDAGEVRWHLQRRGEGPGDAAQRPRIVLLHGAGASTHSWRGLLDLLGDDVDALAVDLPGHGFSSALPPACSGTLGFARALDALLQRLELSPDLIVGHSAGAAVAIRYALDVAPVPVLAVNGALVSLGGLAGRWFAPAARLVADRGPLVRLVARQARRPDAVARRLEGTGSRFSEVDLALYRRLLADEAHVSGVLRMMANWDLPELEPRLARLRSPVHLLDAAGDRTLRPGYRRRVRARLAAAGVLASDLVLEGFGHLLHEEAPVRVAEHVRGLLAAGASACDTVLERAGAAGRDTGETERERA